MVNDLVGSASTLPAFTDTPGLYRADSSTFYLRGSDSTGYADATFAYGPAGESTPWVPLAGDWTGSGVTTIGLYDPATSVFYLKDSNSGGYADTTFAYGPAGAGWLPIVGDWTGSGKTTIGLYDPATSTFYLKDSNSSGYADMTFSYGPAGSTSTAWLPLAGDWSGGGKTTVGLYDPAASTFYLKDSNSGGPADTTFTYLPAGSTSTAVASVGRRLERRRQDDRRPVRSGRLDLLSEGLQQRRAGRRHVCLRAGRRRLESDRRPLGPRGKSGADGDDRRQLDRVLKFALRSFAVGAALAMSMVATRNALIPNDFMAAVPDVAGAFDEPRAASNRQSPVSPASTPDAELVDTVLRGDTIPSGPETTLRLRDSPTLDDSIDLLADVVAGQPLDSSAYATFLARANW